MARVASAHRLDGPRSTEGTGCYQKSGATERTQSSINRENCQISVSHASSLEDCELCCGRAALPALILKS